MRGTDLDNLVQAILPFSKPFIPFVLPLLNCPHVPFGSRVPGRCSHSRGDSANHRFGCWIRKKKCCFRSFCIPEAKTLTSVICVREW